MRFMMLMIPKGYESAAPGTVPGVDAVAAMMKYNQALQEAGVLLALDGLHPPSTGARCPASENEIIEVRQVQEMGDFPEDVQAAASGFSETQSKGRCPPVRRSVRC